MGMEQWTVDEGGHVMGQMGVQTSAIGAELGRDDEARVMRVKGDTMVELVWYGRGHTEQYYAGEGVKWEKIS